MLVVARIAILPGPLASVLYGLDMWERQQRGSPEYAGLLQSWTLAVGAPVFVALVMPAVLILGRLRTPSTRGALLRRAGIALVLPCGWLVFATLEQMGDLDEWLFFALAVLPCIAVVAMQVILVPTAESGQRTAHPQ